MVASLGQVGEFPDLAEAMQTEIEAMLGGYLASLGEAPAPEIA